MHHGGRFRCFKATSASERSNWSQNGPFAFSFPCHGKYCQSVNQVSILTRETWMSEMCTCSLTGQSLSISPSLIQGPQEYSSRKEWTVSSLPLWKSSDSASSITVERLWVDTPTCVPSLCFLELLSRTELVLLAQCQMTAPFLQPLWETGLGQKLLSLHFKRVI